MAPTPAPRQKWVEEGLRALAAGGPDAVRIEPLAKALGVTKGGFYWHFDDRQALLDELLDTWEQASIDQVIAAIEAEGGDPRARLHQLFALVPSYVDQGLLGVDLAIREWARREPAVGERLLRVDNRRIEYLRSLFGAFCPDKDEVEARCMIVLSLFVGSSFIAVEHGRRSRRQVVESILERLES